MEGRALTPCLHFGNALNSVLKIFPWLPITQRTEYSSKAFIIFICLFSHLFIMRRRVATRATGKGTLQKSLLPFHHVALRLPTHPHLLPLLDIATFVFHFTWTDMISPLLDYDSLEISSLYPGSPASGI